MNRSVTRRQFVGASGIVATTLLAGCGGPGGEEGDGEDGGGEDGGGEGGGDGEGGEEDGGGEGGNGEENEESLASPAGR